MRCVRSGVVDHAVIGTGSLAVRDVFDVSVMLGVRLGVEAVHLSVIHHDLRREECVIAPVLHAAVDRAVFAQIVAVHVL